jgi:hypothetical protein
MWDLPGAALGALFDYSHRPGWLEVVGAAVAPSGLEDAWRVGYGTLAEYAGEVIKRRRAGGLKPTTLSAYERYAARDIVPSRLGQMLLTDIRRSHVNAFLAELTAGPSVPSPCPAFWRRHA